MRKARISIVLLLLSGLLLLPMPALAEGEEQASDAVADATVLSEEATEEQADSLDGAIDAVPADAPEPTSGEVEVPMLGEPEEPVHEDGWETTDEGTFYWSGGSKVTGWLELDGFKFYLDPSDGHVLSGGIFEVDGAKYYFRPAGSSWGPEGSMGTGWLYGSCNPATDSFFDRETGALVETGWLKDGGTWYYIDPSTGAPLKGGIFEVDGESYYFRPTGVMGRGWLVDYNGADYFFDRTTGVMAKDGIFAIDGASYYFRPTGVMGRGWLVDYNGANYFFDRTSGRMLAGGVYEADWSMYYFGDDGAIKTGWIDASDGKHYADPSTGKLYRNGIFEIDGESYYFRPTSVMGRGWLRNYEGNTFFFDRSTGAMVKDGVFEIDGGKYVFRGAGNAWGPEGSMGTGWLNGIGHPDSDSFFDRSTGRLVESGWLNDYNTWYYIDPGTGECLKNGIYPVNGEKYYFRPTGVMGTGWLTNYGSPAANYFFDRSSGKMYRNGTYIIDGWPYKADAEGKLKREPSRYPYMMSIAQDYSSPTGYLILIDAGNNVICVYQGYYGNWVPVKESLCSTGAPATYTPSGVYYSGAQGYSFSGDGHTCYYYTQIYGDVLIHSILYHEYTFDVLDGRLGYHISGGCVRCPLDVAKWIYDNIPYYTKIVVFR
ncbi:MAG: L,D-transpeptidase family protein [Atopobiaceae bacterium]|nr:L,D-transpeptidase family protein [Atopobiaceae bacterium]